MESVIIQQQEITLQIIQDPILSKAFEIITNHFKDDALFKYMELHKGQMNFFYIFCILRKLAWNHKPGNNFYIKYIKFYMDNFTYTRKEIIHMYNILQDYTISLPESGLNLGDRIYIMSIWDKNYDDSIFKRIARDRYTNPIVSDFKLSRSIIKKILLNPEKFEAHINFIFKNQRDLAFKIIEENKNKFKKNDIYILSYGKRQEFEEKIFSFLLNNFNYTDEELAYILTTCKVYFHNILLPHLSIGLILKNMKYVPINTILDYLASNSENNFVEYMLKFPKEILGQYWLSFVVDKYIDTIIKCKKDITEHELIECLKHVSNPESIFKNHKIFTNNISLGNMCKNFPKWTLIFKKYYDFNIQDSETILSIFGLFNAREQFNIVSKNIDIRKGFNNLCEFIPLFKPLVLENKKLADFIGPDVLKIQFAVDLVDYLVDEERILKVLSYFENKSHKIYLLGEIYEKKIVDKELVLSILQKLFPDEKLSSISFIRANQYRHSFKILTETHRIYNSSNIVRYNILDDTIEVIQNYKYGYLVNQYSREYFVDEIITLPKILKIKLLEIIPFDEDSCCICFENSNKHIIFLPCCHNVCSICAPKLTKCPLCRSKIKDWIELNGQI